jgi:hypothetical protein
MINTQAVQLLSAWITNGLVGYQGFSDWQIAWFGSTNAAAAQPYADADGDRALNYLEYLTGTSPLNSGAYWGANIVSLTGKVAVVFSQLANRGFEVQSNASLSNPSGWVPLDVAGNEPFFSSTNRNGAVWDPISAQPRYYRVRVFEP